MTEEALREANKLIAEYLGAKIHNWHPESENSKLTFVYPKPYAHGLSAMHEDSLKYHTSMDWLLPVLKKISEDGYMWILNENYCGIIKRTRVLRNDVPRFESSEHRKEAIGHGAIRMYTWQAANPVEAVITAVVKFLKWLKENPYEE